MTAATEPRPRKFAVMVQTLVYFLALIWIYVNFLNIYFPYLSFSYDPENLKYAPFSLAVCLWISRRFAGRLRQFSRFFLCMLFYFSFIPIMAFVPLQEHAAINPVTFQIVMTAAFLTAWHVSGVKLTVAPQMLSPMVFYAFILSAYAAMVVYIIYMLGDSLHFAGATEIYEQRSVGGEAVVGSYVAYATGILSCAVAPLLLAIGIVRRNLFLFVLGAAGLVLVYMAAALKSVLLTILFIPAFYIFAYRRGSVSGQNIGKIALALIALPLAMFTAFGWSNDPTPSNMLISMIFMRTIGLPASLTGLYGEFFATNPTTGYSHINIIGKFVAYPYDQPLGKIISEFALGSPGMNANASFWATDGFAALGMYGLLLAGALIGLVLLFADALTRKADQRIVFVSSIPFIMIIMNSSMFTSLLTGGGGLLFLFLYMFESSENRRRHLAANPEGAGPALRQA